jgi:hypothetical protein
MQESIQVSNHFQVGNIYNAAKRRKERWRGFVVLEKGQVIVQEIPGRLVFAYSSQSPLEVDGGYSFLIGLRRN